MARYAIIVAGGTGTRFSGPVPKQFLELAGRPVLMRTVDRFAQCVVGIVVVLPDSERARWRELIGRYGYATPHTVVSGGDSRFASVKNALAVVDAQLGDVVAVHDGVRPLVAGCVVEKAFEVAARCGSAVPVVPVTDSIRHVAAGGVSRAMRRDELVAVQTPQAFDAVALKAAYDVDFSPLFTDDASVYEAAGHSVTLIDGDPGNIKITHPKDIAIAEMILRNGTAR